MLQHQYSNKINQNKQLNNCINVTNKISNQYYMCTSYQSLVCFDINLNDENDITKQQQQQYMYMYIGLQLTLTKW